MLLYHCFPSALARRAPGRMAEELRSKNTFEAGKLILQAIMEHGLLLTRELLEIPANPRTRRSVAYVHRQVRACFTLCERSELAVATVRGDPPCPTSHCDLFGDFAIGIDPLQARSFGAMPTIYFYRGRKVEADARADDLDSEGGLSFQFFYRLIEIMEILRVVLRLEADSDWNERMSAAEIRAAALNLDNYPEIEQALDRISKRGEAKALHSVLFDTDRVPAWNLVDAIGLMLDLFQVADSRTRNTPLAYFQQREWRIPSVFRNSDEAMSRRGLYPLRDQRNDALRKLVEGVERLSPAVAGTQRKFDFSDCWVRSGLGGKPFWHYVEEVVVPRGKKQEIEDFIGVLSDHVPRVVSVDEIGRPAS
jgi:hypothetical protein